MGVDVTKVTGGVSKPLNFVKLREQAPSPLKRDGAYRIGESLNMLFTSALQGRDERFLPSSEERCAIPPFPWRKAKIFSPETQGSQILSLAGDSGIAETACMTIPPPNQLSFLSPRHGSNAWAQRRDVIEAWKRRSQIDVAPMTMEYMPILACDADCPLCPFRRSRLQACDGIIPTHEIAPEDDCQSATRASARRVLEAACEAGCQGVLVTGGGEPAIWQPLLTTLAYSTELGMVNALYTNGFRLGWEKGFAEKLLAPENGLVFVRMSINAITAQAVKRHWGLDVQQVSQQLFGLQNLFQARQRWLSEYQARGQRLPSIQISTIVDRLNVCELPLICATVAEIVTTHRQCAGDEDIMVVRPLTIHGRKSGYSFQDHDDAVIRDIIAYCGNRGAGRRRLAEAGVTLYLGFGLAAVESGAMPSYSALLEQEYAQRDISWANGLFLTVGPDSSVFLSTETGCNPAWALGNLKTQSVAEVYKGKRRREVLDDMNSQRWGPAVSQPTSRTARLDRIARAIMNGHLSDSAIEAIRLASLKSHSLMLD